MPEKYLSLRAAATMLGYASTSPIEDALKSGELKGERRPGVVRNGRSTSPWRIQHEDLATFAEARGRPLDEAAEASDQNSDQELSPDSPPADSEATAEVVRTRPDRAAPVPPRAAAEAVPLAPDVAELLVRLTRAEARLEWLRELAEQVDAETVVRVLRGPLAQPAESAPEQPTPVEQPAPAAAAEEAKAPTPARRRRPRTGS